MYKKENISFNSDEIVLRGWFYTPTSVPAPCIIMAHGFAALKEHYLDKFASKFAQEGFNVLVYDNRNFGDSDGKPRFEVDPVGQLHDMSNAITFVQQKTEVNPDKIGVWGTSYSGGIVLAIAAMDKRIKCVVSQVPFISGHHKYLKLEQLEAMRRKYNDDRIARSAGKNPVTLQVVPTEINKNAIMKIPTASSFFTSVPTWENKVTLRSIENSGEFEPIAYVRYINQPTLFLVANKDTINTTELALIAYKKIKSPKNLVMIEGDHFVPYVEEFNICVSKSIKWFLLNLSDNLQSEKALDYQQELLTNYI